jgi:hypothetical protein
MYIPLFSWQCVADYYSIVTRLWRGRGTDGQAEPAMLPTSSTSEGNVTQGIQGWLCDGTHSATAHTEHRQVARMTATHIRNVQQ